MADHLSKEQRSSLMSRISSTNTRPEKIVRSLLHSMGYRFRLHRKDLPGKPDIILPKYNTVIFVHGCFWHRHSCKKGQSIPVTNKSFWENKFKNNRRRDKEIIKNLRLIKWNVLIIWECKIKEIESLITSLKKIKSAL